MLAASLAGLDRQAGWAVAISVAELVGNVLKFAEYGVLELRIVDGAKRGLEVTVDDDGPGIVNIELALIDGYSEGRFIAIHPGLLPRRGLGTGLGAVRRLMDEMQIESVLGRGTRVVARKWCR
jgi:serine/threonine-protein kinase RsbT